MGLQVLYGLVFTQNIVGEQVVTKIHTEGEPVGDKQAKATAKVIGKKFIVGKAGVSRAKNELVIGVKGVVLAKENLSWEEVYP